MAPNTRAGAKKAKNDAIATTATIPATNGSSGGTYDGSVISKEEVEARGCGTEDDGDTYDSNRIFHCEKRVFYTGIMSLTRLPCPGWCDHHPAFMMRSRQWFPFIGAIIGLWGAVWLYACTVLWPPAIAAVVSVFSTVWLTGCMHEDGISDCFDGFGGGWSKAQILRIMEDSRIGTYALIGMILTMALKLRSLEVLIATQGTWAAAAAVVAAHAASRWTSLPLVYTCKYVLSEQHAKGNYYNWFAKSQRLVTPIRILFGTTVAVLVPYLMLTPWQAVAVYVTVVLITITAANYGNSILGGVVGDFLGATIYVSECPSM